MFLFHPWFFQLRLSELKPTQFRSWNAIKSPGRLSVGNSFPIRTSKLPLLFGSILSLNFQRVRRQWLKSRLKKFNFNCLLEVYFFCMFDGKEVEKTTSVFFVICTLIEWCFTNYILLPYTIWSNASHTKWNVSYALLRFASKAFDCFSVIIFHSLSRISNLFFSFVLMAECDRELDFIAFEIAHWN